MRYGPTIILLATLLCSCSQADTGGIPKSVHQDTTHLQSYCMDASWKTHTTDSYSIEYPTECRKNTIGEFEAWKILFDDGEYIQFGPDSERGSNGEGFWIRTTKGNDLVTAEQGFIRSITHDRKQSGDTFEIWREEMALNGITAEIVTVVVHSDRYGYTGESDFIRDVSRNVFIRLPEEILTISNEIDNDRLPFNTDFLRFLRSFKTRS